MAARGETGGLFDKIKAAAHTAKTSTCTTHLMLEQMAPADRADLQRALDDKTIASTVIVKVLQGAGYRISADPLQRHRRGACACGRTG